MIIEKLHDYGIYTIPLNGKIPILNDWQRLPESYWENEEYKNTKAKNIGVVCGKRSGIIALDLDVIDPALQKKVMALINPSPVARYGSKKKLPTYFYQYEEKYNQKITIKVGPTIGGKVQAVELLTNGQQCMIPPSVHPDGHLCEWVGLELLDPEELPTLDESSLVELAKIYNQNEPLIGGRNDTLKNYISAKILEGKSPNDCILEIMEHDAKFDKPLFTDKSEMKGDPLHNATIFYLNILKSIGSKTKLPDWRENKSIEIVDSKRPSYKEVKFPKFRGIAQEIFRYIYDSSPVPRSRLAMASTLSIMSTIYGNRISINGFLPNLYCMIVAPSGYGKNNPMKAPAALFHSVGKEHMLGETPASDSAIIYDIDSNRVRLDVIDEASRLFSGSDDTRNYSAGRIADVYADLYTSSGTYYKGKKAMSYRKDGSDSATIGSCFSPHVSILAAMTVEDFQTSFSERLMGKGLGGRFLYFVDEEMKKAHTPKIFEIPLFLEMELKKILDAQLINLTKDSKISIPRAAIQPKAKEEMEKYLDYLYSIQKETSKLRSVSQRFSAIFHKMILIDTLSMGRFEVKNDSVEWAVKWCNAYLAYLPLFLEQNLYSSNADKTEQQIENYFLQAGTNGATKTELCKAPELRRLNILTKQRNEIIKSLISSEVLFAKDQKIYHSTFGKNLGINEISKTRS